MVRTPATSRPADACAACGAFCVEVGGLVTCRPAEAEMGHARYHCAGHPFAKAGTNCGWEGVLQGSDTRDPQCPNCGGWVDRVNPDGARLRVVR